MMYSMSLPGDANRVLALVPSLFGHSGDSINEGQLLRSLCKGRRCLVISLIGLTKLPRLKRYLREVYEEGWPREAVLLPIAMPILLSTLLTLSASIMVVPIYGLLVSLSTLTSFT